MRLPILICFLTIAYSSVLAQSSDSVRISFVDIAPNPQATIVHAVNGSYSIPAQVSATYPNLSGKILVYPHKLCGPDSTLKITAFQQRFVLSKFYEISEPSFVQQDTWKIDSILRTFDQSNYAKSSFSRDSFLLANQIIVERHDYSIGDLDYTTHTYVKYTDFSADHKLYFDSLEKVNETYRKQVSQRFVNSVLTPFYISQTEVTNAQYREFVTWVRDSIAFSLLYNELDDDMAVHLLNGTNKQLKQLNPSEKAQNLKKYGFNYSLATSQKHNLYENPDYLPYLDQLLYYPRPERFYKRREIDVNKLQYESKAISPTPVYPDTLCWQKEIASPGFMSLSHSYFWHPAYDNYPVVGLIPAQMKAYCDWYQHRLNAANSDKSLRFLVEIPALYHYEMATKYCTTLNRVNTIDVHAPEPFISYRDTLDALAFVTRAYAGPMDYRADYSEPQRKLAAWLMMNATEPVFGLAGNVSEYLNAQPVSDSSGNEQMIVQGANAFLNLTNPDENQLNTVFYQRTIPATGSCTVGFRTIVYVDRKQR